MDNQPILNYHQKYYKNNKNKFGKYYLKRIKTFCEMCKKDYVDITSHYKTKRHIKNIIN